MDLRYRHELKYLVHESDALMLKQVLKKLMPHDDNAGVDGRYRVRSLYFDDVFKTAFYEKQDGLLLRNKYRIRTYGKGAPIRAEIKHKYDRYIAKQSTTIKQEDYYNLLAGHYDFLLSSKNNVLLAYYVQLTSSGLRPCIIVDYDREAYILNEGNVRVTFDHNVRAGSNTNDILSDDVRSIPVLPGGTLVLEVKYDEFLPDRVRMLLNLDAHVQLAVSKYILCRMTQFV